MPNRLKIYVADDCPTCDETKKLVATIAGRYQDLEIDLMNLNDADTICPDYVFAVPTFVYNERIIFLGNPSLKELDESFGRVTNYKEPL